MRTYFTTRKQTVLKSHIYQASNTNRRCAVYKTTPIQNAICSSRWDGTASIENASEGCYSRKHLSLVGPSNFSAKRVDGKPKFRFCVDFRALNTVMKLDPYPLPRFDEATSTLFGSKYFTVLDCYSGFWQVNIKKECKERIGFTVPSGQYEFNRLPFGLSNSPSNFQRLMDVLLRNLVRSECYVFMI